MTTPTVFLDLNREITTTRSEINYHYGKAAQCRNDEQLIELNLVVVSNAYSPSDTREDGVIKYNNILDEGESTLATIDVTVNDNVISAQRRYLHADDSIEISPETEDEVVKYTPSEEWPAAARPTEEELRAVKLSL